MDSTDLKNDPHSPYDTQQGAYPPPQGYATQHAQYGQQGATANPTVIITKPATPNDCLGFSIFTCLCCFWPTGIAAILFSCQSRDAAKAGDMVTAGRKGLTARTLAIVSLFLGIVAIIIIILLSRDHLHVALVGGQRGSL